MLSFVELSGREGGSIKKVISLGIRVQGERKIKVRTLLYALIIRKIKSEIKSEVLTLT